MQIKFSTDIRVRYADTDKMGFVYNGNYFAYFEVGRTELMRNHGLPYSEFERQGYFLPLTEAHVQYKTPGFYDDVLTIETTLTPEYKPTVRFDYKVWRGTTLVAEGYTVHSFMNQETQKAVKPPKFYLELINAK